MGRKTRELRAMKSDERAKALVEDRRELMHARGVAAMGGAPANPGEIRDIRRTIARNLTVQKEEGDSE